MERQTSYYHYMHEHLSGRVNIHAEYTQIPNGMAQDREAERICYGKEITDMVHRIVFLTRN